MLNEKKILALILARGGSKGLPGKNILPLKDKPLIAWTIESAKKSKYIDRIVLSTDSNEIAEVAQKFGCDVPFMRPAELAKDSTPSIDPIIHALQALPREFDSVLILQPTSPLRSTDDIDGIIEYFYTEQASTAVSVTEVESHPYWTFRIEGAKLVPFIDDGLKATRRQDLPPAYSINGALYLTKTDFVLKNRALIDPQTIAYKMPQERSIDIDTGEDLALCEFYLQKRQTSA